MTGGTSEGLRRGVDANSKLLFQSCCSSLAIKGVVMVRKRKLRGCPHGFIFQTCLDLCLLQATLILVCDGASGGGATIG